MGASERKRLRITLQGKLLGVMVLCVVVPVLFMGGYLMSLSKRTLRAKVRETVENHLLRKESLLAAWMGDRLRESARWSGSFIVYEGLEALTKPRASADVQRDLAAYLESILGHYRVYESFFIVNTKGEVLAATRDERLEEWVKPLLSAAASSDVAHVSPLFSSAHLGRPTQVIFQPIFAPRERGGEPLGYFVMRLDLRELESVLAQAEVATQEAALKPPAWLLDDEGRVLARQGKVVERPGEEAFPVPPRAAAATGDDLVETDVAGTRSLVAVRALSTGFDGYLAATVPRGEAYRALDESQWRLGFVGAAVILVIVGVSYLAARGILRPVGLLVEGARRVADGDLDVYLPVRGRDEIADLTVAFNDMAARIREGRASLEAARDELARTNEGLRSANKTLETLAITDGLTSLYNHRHFQDMLEKELRRCEEQGRPLSLLLIDIDHFKQFNDRWGHQEGDAALRRVAAQITKTIRATDHAFRYGGEELAVLLPFCPKTRAAEVAEKVRVAVRANAQRPGRFGDRITVSIGVATFPEDGRVGRGLVDAADASLYAAKAAGRDRVMVAGDKDARTTTA